jgi:hypothetical protein
VPNGGGVFSTGNATWIGALADSTLIPPNVVPDPIPGVSTPLLRVMENLYAVIGMGAASVTQPSQGNWQSVYGSGASSIKVPTVNNAA